MVLVLCTSYDHAYICTFIFVIKRTLLPIFKYSKGNYFIKTACGVMVPVSCTSSDDALYLYKSS